MTAPVDPRRCPLCQGSNACALAEGKASCWCFDEKFRDDALARIPLEARDKACLCANCAQGGVTQASLK